MTRALPPIFFLVCLVCAHVATATTILEADLSIANLQARLSYQLMGSLAAFTQNGTATDCAIHPGFSIQAGHLFLENDTKSLSIHAGTETSTVGYNPTTRTEDYEIALAQGTRNRAGCQMVILPLPGAPAPRVDVRGSCGTATPSVHEQVNDRPWVNFARKSVAADTRQAIRWLGCTDSAEIGVMGDFRLSLWAWNFTVTAEGRTEAFTTGSTSLLPPGVPGLVAHDQQAFLTVSNGTLTTTLSGSAYRLYLGASELRTDQLQLEGATGHLAVAGQSVQLHQDGVQVEGQSSLRIAGTGVGQRFEAQLSGQPDSLAVNGVAVPLASLESKGKGLGWLWLPGAIGLVAAPALAAPLLRRRRHERPGMWDNVDRLLENRDYAAAAAVTKKMVAAFPRSPGAHYRHATVLKHLQQERKALWHHEEARRLLRQQSRPEPTLWVENALEAARAAARLHARQTGEQQYLAYLVQEWAREALAADPNVLRSLEGHAELEPFLMDAFWQTPYWLLP